MFEIIIGELNSLKNLEKEKILSGFFKTGKGEYGEGDKFLGITVPNQRIIAKKYFLDCSFDDIENLLRSKYHEYRMTGFLILCYKQQYFMKKKTFDKIKQKEIVDFYISHLKYANNWDLVDLSCGAILGNYLIDKDKSILYNLVNDENLRKQRISIVCTLSFVRNGDFNDAIKISEKLLNHEHDLIHKAVGRVLREIGKKDEILLKDFLNKHIKELHRTTLRYAIEKFDTNTKKYYLSL